MRQLEFWRRMQKTYAPNGTATPQQRQMMDQFLRNYWRRPSAAHQPAPAWSRWGSNNNNNNMMGQGAAAGTGTGSGMGLGMWLGDGWTPQVQSMDQDQATQMFAGYDPYTLMSLLGYPAGAMGMNPFGGMMGIDPTGGIGMGKGMMGINMSPMMNDMAMGLMGFDPTGSMSLWGLIRPV
ncbi:uncharacterized protein Z519_07566 [Cladophialophora bantiana CBS 173.52]|uniref:Uncharacterized protein n=1 Tax=Cladophialophora bantiana (strain ATCC 10958 / CBS 173.52 / CDC B-1940 / NIH 8579) TaxID=1442370 RepID=A0A0D2I3Y6_CLAB1|nr:uncharacterized protein Z519_07566 [Cladophialophora bantiana CBS 173.52]KIW91599.1 hypothetical protein Z519_07566 [Cladophialophora bantiana CBS 173.52]